MKKNFKDMKKNSSIANESSEEENFYLAINIMESQPWLKYYETQLFNILKLCENLDQKKLIESLLENFFYFNEIKERQACTLINSKIQQWGLKPESTWVIAIADRGEVDGSTAGLQKLKNKIVPLEKWHSRFIPNITEPVAKIEGAEDIVLFDDFIGTGQKMLKKEKWLIDALIKKGVDTSNINVHFVSFSGMEFGVKHIESKSKHPVFVAHRLKKGISEQFEPSQVPIYIELMMQLEGKLSKKYKNKKLPHYSLGYDKSESLYCGANDNCPNNVFPVFWWPCLHNGKQHETILTRAG